VNQRRSAAIEYTKRLNREFAERGDVAGANELIEAMVADGVAPTLVTCHPCLTSHAAANDGYAACPVHDGARGPRQRCVESSQAVPRGTMEFQSRRRPAAPQVTMNTLIKCYRNARRPEGADATLHSLDKWGLAPDGCAQFTTTPRFPSARVGLRTHRIVPLRVQVRTAP